MSYVRKYESEADLFAFEKMLISSISPQSFINIMKRIFGNNNYPIHTDFAIARRASENSSRDKRVPFVGIILYEQYVSLAQSIITSNAACYRKISMYGVVVVAKICN
jgi:hypothetical protein